MKVNMDLDLETINIINKPFLTRPEVMKLARVKESTASSIIGIAKEKFNGYCSWSSYVVRTDAVLQALGLDKEKILEDFKYIVDAFVYAQKLNLKGEENGK